MWRCLCRYILMMIQRSTLITVHQLKILQYITKKKETKVWFMLQRNRLEISKSQSLPSFHLKLLSLSVHACSSTFCIRESWLIFFYQINEARMWNTVGENNWSIPPNPRRVGYIVLIYGLLDGPLYMGSIYTNTLPQSELPVQRCSRLDNKKANTTLQSELPSHRCSRLDKKKVQRATGAAVFKTGQQESQHPLQFELPLQRCSRLNKKKVQRANTPPRSHN
jgi:hypothetical protein